MRALRSLWRNIVASRVLIASMIVGLIVWEIVVRAFHVPKFLVPAPTDVVNEFLGNQAWYWNHAYYTLAATLLGFGIAVVFGVVLAVIIISSRWVEQTIYAALVAFNSIPKVAIAPLFIIWVGTGFGSKVTMAAVISIFAIVINAVLGLRSIEPDLVDLAKSMGAGRAGLLLKVRFPNALPGLFSGMKVGISLALIGTIVGEFVASSSGLGYVIMTAQSTFATPRIFAALVLLAVMGTILFFIIDILERLILPWHVSNRLHAGEGA